METGLLREIEDSPKEEDNLKKGGNLKKRMTKNVDNPEKENGPKRFAGRGAGLIILYFFYKYLIT